MFFSLEVKRKKTADGGGTTAAGGGTTAAGGIEPTADTTGNRIYEQDSKMLFIILFKA